MMAERAILIDAANRKIDYIECRDYKDMTQYLPGGITVCWIFHDTTGDVVYVDDEALLRPAVCAFRWKLNGLDGQPMMSNGIVTGRDHPEIDKDGDLIETTLDPEMTPAQIAEHVEWLTVEEALSWFRSKADEPATYVTSIHSGGTNTTVTSHWNHWLRNLIGN